MGLDNMQTRHPLPLPQLLILLFLSSSSCWPLLGCSAKSSAACQSVDRAALLAFKAGVTADPAKTLATWSPSRPNCCSQWKGVTCDASTGRVTQLSLSSAQLSGAISPALSALSQLQTLALDANSFTGPIPNSFGRLTQLQQLDVSYNKLSGPLPASIGGMASLQHIRIYNNLISGAIPASFGQLSNLFNADLAHNRLSGRLPDAFTANLTSLFFLYLDHNQITGLPNDLSKLRSLQIVTLDGNPVGSLTNIGGLATLPKLGELHLSGCGLSGQFPSWVANLKQLQDNSDEVTPLIDLSHNALTGPIPSQLGSVANIQSLSLNNNQLSGAIPSTLASLTTLRFLNLQQNKLSGRIPSAFAALQSLATFNVSYNQLSGPIPQVAPFTSFPVSSYEHNPGLCGSPLPKKCT